MPGLLNLISLRRGSRRRPRAQGSRVRRSTVVPPSLSNRELATLAGIFLFYRSQALATSLPADIASPVTALLWRAASLVVMGERGTGPAIHHGLKRCAQAIDRYDRSRQAHLEQRSILTGSGIDDDINRYLHRFLSGPDQPLDRLVELLAPELAPTPRRQIAAALEDLIRDVADQLGFTRSVNP